MQTLSNHNSGGQLENNPIQEHKPILTLLESLPENFRTSADFYKNSYANNDEGVFWG
jgi:alpha-amylase